MTKVQFILVKEQGSRAEHPGGFRFDKVNKSRQYLRKESPSSDSFQYEVVPDRGVFPMVGCLRQPRLVSPRAKLHSPPL